MTHTHEKALEARRVLLEARPERRLALYRKLGEGHGVVITRHDWRTNGDLLERIAATFPGLTHAQFEA
jgi:hypothetical protein